MFTEYILVTGGAGFIGSSFLNTIVKDNPNFHFTCIDKLNYASNYSSRNLDDILNLPNFRFIKSDLSKDLATIENVLFEPNDKNSKVTTIIHFAAESSVDRSFIDPVGFMNNNLGATQNLLDCSRKLLDEQPHLRSKFKFIHISTDEVYGETMEYVDETSALNPTNPYSASKAACDIIILAYNKSYKIPTVIIRPNNVYGPNQHEEKIIPLTISNILANKRIPLHGNGCNQRAYLHVFDLIEAIKLIWIKFDEDQRNQNCLSRVHEINGQIFNIGSQCELSNLQLVKTIACMMEKWDDGKCIDFITDRIYNDKSYRIQYDKIKSLGWQQKIMIDKGLKSLIVNSKTKKE